MSPATNEGRGTSEPREPQLKSIRAGKILFGKRENKISPSEGELESGSRGSEVPRVITTAADVFRAAGGLGVRLAVSGGFIEWQASQTPPQDFLAAIAAIKPELVEILHGDRCRWCGDRLAWPGPAGIVFADHTAECMPCTDREVAACSPPAAVRSRARTRSRTTPRSCSTVVCHERPASKLRCCWPP